MRAGPVRGETDHVANTDQEPRSEPATSAATTSRAVADRLVAPQPWWSDATVASLLALGNFAAVTLMVLHLVSRFQHDHNDVGRNMNFMLGSDLATPLVGWLWLLILLNGLGLSMCRPTRAAGVGLVVAAGVIAIPVVTWVLWTFATFASG
jgi:hypothetical protein